MFKRAARYQNGSLTIEKRKTGPAVWVFRWREFTQQGSINPKRIIGTKAQFPTKRDAMKAVEGLRLDINAEAAVSHHRTLTVSDLWEHYKETEIAGDRLSPSTKDTYRIFVERYITPVWGDYRLQDVKAVSVERWLAELTYAPTKAKLRNILSALYQHAIRREWIDRNPIRDVRQSAKRQLEPDILEPQEIQSLLVELPEPCKTMVMVAALTGMRVSEILGLQWQDVDLENGILHLRRGVVNQHVTALKTAGSKRPLPIPAQLVKVLSDWRQQAYYNQTEHWVFASPHTGGKHPYWPGTLLQRLIQPAAKRAGISKHIGWHSFRRSFATLLYANEADVKTTQELMRHSTPIVTMDIYAQAVTVEKRLAQSRTAGLILAQQGTQEQEVST
jgi:integrase